MSSADSDEKQFEKPRNTFSEQELTLDQKLRGAKHLSEYDLINEGLIPHSEQTTHAAGKELCIYYHPRTKQLFFFNHHINGNDIKYEFWWSAYMQQ